MEVFYPAYHGFASNHHPGDPLLRFDPRGGGFLDAPFLADFPPPF
jgi:hypothetical protein